MAIHPVQLIDAWLFTPGIDMHSARRVAAEGGGHGDVRIAILTTGAGWMRAEVVGGAPRPGYLIFMPDRGMFVVTRRDDWTDAKGGSPRVLVTLKTADDVSAMPDARSRAS